ncbi:MAG: ABC transporter permease, partial [Terriglobales bacterium]
MTGLFQYLRYAIRQLRKSPGFATVAILTLALGIGANTAVFSVMDAVLMRMLPVQDPQRLYYLRIATGNQPPGGSNTGNSDNSFSEPVFEALRQRTDVLDDVIAYVPLNIGKVAVRYGDAPEEAQGDEVSGNFFFGLTAGIFRGRGLSLQDEKHHSQVAVISYDYWTRRFSRDPAVFGTTLFVKNVPLTIVGIAARDFRGVEPAIATDFWIPLQNRPELNAWGTSVSSSSLYGTPKWWCLPLIARLKRNVSPEQAQSALQSTFGEAAKIGVGTIDPKKWKPLLSFNPAKGIEGFNQQYSEPVRILMGLVVLVLLIACANVALLIMARNEVRQREFSLRLAVGAEKAHLFRQLLTESSLLVLAGTGVGWMFALFATDALAAWSGIETGLSPNRTVLLFTLGISAVSALAFGIAPLWIALQAPVSGVLRATATNITQDRRRTLGGRALMSAQVAVCLLLLVAATLLLHT